MKREILAVKYYPVLKALVSIKDKKVQQRLLKALCREQVFRNCICEIARNTAKQNISLSAKDKSKINKHSIVVKRLLRKKPSGFNQSGGFLNVAVPLLAATIGELIGNAVRK